MLKVLVGPKEPEAELGESLGKTTASWVMRVQKGWFVVGWVTLGWLGMGGWLEWAPLGGSSWALSVRLGLRGW